MDEHRRSERRSALLQVDLTEHLDGKTLPVEGVDLAAHGVFLLTKRPGRFHCGQAVTLRIHLIDRDEPVVVAGEVVRIVEKAEAKQRGGRVGIAVEFLTRHDALGATSLPSGADPPTENRGRP